MPQRTSQDRDAHDTLVESHARALSEKGWTVRADIAGWDQPPSIDGHRPDIHATQDEHTWIVEVETDPDEDTGQHQAFREAAKGDPSTEFYGLVADANGERAGSFR